MKIAFTTSRNWVSAAIRWVTRSRASHSLISFDVYGEPMFLHADMGGIQITVRDKFLVKNHLVAEFETVREVPYDLLKMALSHVGDNYDYVGILGFVWPVMLGRWLGKKFTNPFASPHGMVCSEFVANIDTVGLILPEFRGLDPEETTPQDLLDICARGPSFKRLS
jgi:hypothetical protein